MIKKRLLVASFVLVIILAGLSMATVKKGTLDMIKINYSVGESLSGEFNLSFVEQKAGVISSSLGGNITLLDLLDNSGYSVGSDYNCVPESCSNTYSATNAEETKVLVVNGKKTVGFLLSGKQSEANSFSFSVSTAFGQSCFNQAYIDLFDDGIFDVYNINYVNNTCGTELRGCFLDSDTTEATVSTGEPYCEKIRLPPAPAYKLGAKVRNSTTGGTLIMKLYDVESGELKGECNLSANNQDLEKLYCIAEYSLVSTRDTFVCVKGSAGSTYRIKTETKNPCGATLDLAQNGDYTVDYDLSAQALEYGKFDFVINETTYSKINGGSLIELINSYLEENYYSDCTPNCVIPVKIASSAENSFTISNIKINYNSASREGIISNQVYEADKQAPTINSSYLLFSLEDTGFTAQNKTGKNTFNLDFDGNNLFSKTIYVTKGFDFSVSPSFASLGINLNFNVIVTNSTIVSSKWNFGDNSTDVIVAGKSASHKYMEEGEFILKVDVVSGGGISSSKTFNIVVGSAKDSANKSLVEYERRLANITKQIGLLPSNLQSEIKNSLNLSKINQTIQNLKNSYSAANDTEDYVAIVGNISEFDVPYSIFVSGKGTLPILIGVDGINSDLIFEIENKSTSIDGIGDKISGWMDKYYNGTISFEEYSAYYDSGKKLILGDYQIKIQKKKEAYSGKVNLFINYPFEEIKFSSAQGQRTLSEGAAVSLPFSNQANIEFIIVGSDLIQVKDLGIYLAPESKYLESIDPENITPFKQGFSWPFFSIALIILIILILILYIILQEWYKRNYERKLFRNPNDLYNIINFIYNARVGGLVDRDIRKKLLNNGWSGEQINYSFRKIDGKRTGMLEIPLFSGREHKKVMQELEKRQNAPLDRRFINSSSF